MSAPAVPPFETVLSFAVMGDACMAILHAGAVTARTGVVVIVGGPQYRVGSHRQFVLLARGLAAAGVPVLRFDYRGLGDSAGKARDFTGIELDIHAAIDVFIASTQVERVVLWGLCDAASAALMYAAQDPRVVGLVLLNPWVHSPASEAKVRLKSYYLTRLRSRDLWRKIARFEFDWRGSLASIRRYVGAAMAAPTGAQSEHFVTRMRKGWAAFTGPVLVLLSGDDLTAAEFRQLCTTPDWRRLLAGKSTATVVLEHANHTFARADWRDAVAAHTLAWWRVHFEHASA